MARSTITKYTSDVSGVEIPEDQLVTVEILHRREHCPGTGDIDEVCTTIDMTRLEAMKLLNTLFVDCGLNHTVQMVALEKSFPTSTLVKRLRKERGEA